VLFLDWVTATILVFFGQFLMYILPKISFPYHGYLWALFPFLVGSTLKSFGVASAFLYIFVVTFFEAIKQRFSVVGAYLFAFLFGFPIMLIMNVVFTILGTAIRKAIR